jgi:hypothetical protein
MAAPHPPARIVRWSAWEGSDAGLEHLTLRPEGESLVARGVAIGTIDGEAFGLSYRIAIDAAWHVREMSVVTANGRELRLESDGVGTWRRAGLSDPALSGCIDVDLQATPFTNTLPIRRLDLQTGQSAAIPVVYVNVPSLAVERLNQRYTALEPGRLVRFEGLDTGFTADLPVDPDGLVTDYPGLFRRL